MFYIPVVQYTDSNLAIQVRTEGGVEGIPLSTVVSARAFYMPRVIATLSAILALTALTLAIVGLYGGPDRRAGVDPVHREPAGGCRST